MRRFFLAAFMLLAATAPAPAQTSEGVAEIARDICLLRGADVPSVEAAAIERGWRALSEDELAALPIAGVWPGFLVGWEVSGGDHPMRLTISASGIISASMRERHAAGEHVVAPPPGEIAPDATDLDRRIQSVPAQACTFYFSGLDSRAVAAALSEMRFRGAALGEPASERELSDPPRVNWFWPIGPSEPRGTDWLALNFTVTRRDGADHGHIEVNQPRAPRI
jgi:hypothetical protein